MGDWRPFVYGGLASMTAECGTFPIDLAKTRLQIQGQKIDAQHTSLKYRGMSHALIRIFKEEGVKALYSGLSPALLRQATYGTIKIGIYYSMKKIIMPRPQDETLYGSIACGIVAGVISSSVANPTDVLKVRMQARNEKFVQKGMLPSFLDIYKQEGVRGLWRGVGPTAQRAAVIAGVELPVYDVSKKRLISSGYMNDNIATHFIASFIAGIAGAVTSTPIDVVKTRMMNQRNVKATTTDVATVRSTKIYTSSMDCVLQTVRNEGILALYKGFIPTWVRLGPWNILFFVSYEQLKKFY